MKVEILKEYDAVLDNKNRCTIRGRTGISHYHITVYKTGKVVMEPRYLARLDELSEKTLRMMDKSVKNMAKGKAGGPIDFAKLKDFIDDEEQ